MVAGCVALLPVLFISPEPFFWLAGLSLGLWLGAAVCMAGCAVGMLLPFLLGRYFLTHRIQRCANDLASPSQSPSIISSRHHHTL